MKSQVFYARLSVALATPVAAFAAQADNNRQSGHYEWRPVPQYGPRATGPARKRVLAPNSAQAAGCECDMMKMSSADADCMKTMHGMMAPSGALAS